MSKHSKFEVVLFAIRTFLILSHKIKIVINFSKVILPSISIFRHNNSWNGAFFELVKKDENTKWSLHILFHFYIPIFKPVLVPEQAVEYWGVLLTVRVVDWLTGFFGMERLIENHTIHYSQVLFTTKVITISSYLVYNKSLKICSL